MTHSLAPGQSRTFEGWLQVEPSGDLAPVVAAEIARRKLPAGDLEGVVAAADGRPVDRAGGRDRAGRQALRLDLGDSAAPTGSRCRPATTRSTQPPRDTPRAPCARASIAAGAPASVDFGELQPPGSIHFAVTQRGTGAPLDARIAIAQGQKPLVEFLGRKVFFTELDRRGIADVALAPGDYVFAVSHGKDVLAAPTRSRRRCRRRDADPARAPGCAVRSDRADWYGADLHHHADQAEAVTPPADLARSQLAAGLDLLFVSDHDFDRQPPSAAGDRRPARRALHPFGRDLHLLGAFQRLPVAAGRAAGDRHQRHQHPRRVRRGAAARGRGGGDQPPLHPLRLLRQPRRRRRALAASIPAST